MSSKKLRFFFIVQGEGRGHMAQALALKDLLVKSGHEVSVVMVGVSPRRAIPDFFREKIGQEIVPFESPNFLLDSSNKSIQVLRSILFNLKRGKVFFKSINKIREKVKESNPDAIVNFYELLCGLYFFLDKPKIKHITLSHHYLLSHPDFPVPKGFLRDRWLMKLNNKLTASGAQKILALSFRELQEHGLKKKFVVPPLLRREVKSVIPANENYILSYVLNKGYAEEIINWHKLNIDFKIHCFWDNSEFPDTYSPHENLTFHTLHDEKFIQYLKSCRAYAGSAGFESVCEAMYLGKPVMVVPTGGHFEQLCNALDAVKSGAGVSAASFNYKILLDFLPEYIPVQEAFQKWVNKAEPLFLKYLEE